MSLLVESWGEGFGLVEDAPLPPSIFVVGDRKQSIYRFRDAEIAVLDEAARFIASLRERSSPRRSITHSFRARPELLAFVNDVFTGLERLPDRSDAFRYDEEDRFPVALAAGGPTLDEDPAEGGRLRRRRQLHGWLRQSVRLSQTAAQAAEHDAG